MYNGLKWLILQARRCMREDLITVYASQASFYLIISALPFAMLLLSLVQFLLPVDATTLYTVLMPLLPQKLHRAAEIVTLELFDRSAGILSLSAVTALWTASRGVAAVSRGVRRVYDIKNPTFLRSAVRDALNTLLLLLIMLLSLAMLMFGTAVVGFMAKHLIISKAVLDFFGGFRVVIFLGVMTLLFAFIYRLIAGKAMPFKKHLWGGAFAALGWVLFSLGYEFYIENFSNYSYIYGSLAAVVLLMLWLYFCMIIFLYGAEINMMLKTERDKK